MEYLVEFGTICTVVLLACMSPGPDFIAVTSNALVARGRGLLVATGIAVACMIWAALAIFGLGVLLSNVAWLYDIVRILGAFYLIWLGAKMLYSASKEIPPTAVEKSNVRAGSSFRVGFLVGMTNPKSAAFFGSLFVTILPPHAPTWVHVSTVGSVGIVALAWFCVLAILFSISRVRTSYTRLRRPLDAVMGVALVGIGTRLAASR